MRGPCCTGLQPDSCRSARALPGVQGVAAHSPLFCVQQWILLPISAKRMVWSHWYPFGIRLLFTNPSPQLLITCTCEVLFARGGFPCLLCCLVLLKALIPLFWPSISHQYISPSDSCLSTPFPAPTTYRTLQSIGHIPTVSRKLPFPLPGSYPAFPGLTLNTAPLYVAAYFSGGLWRKPPI